MYLPYGSIDLSAFHLKPTEGDHLDEADSAMDAMRDKLDPAHFRVLEHLAGRGPTRGNPPHKKDYRWHMLSSERLFRMAFLTTGQWGPPTKDLWFRGVQTVSNPRAGRWAWEVPFFTRMADLSEEIVQQIAYVTERYESKGSKARDWVFALDKCRRAVEWVIGQETAARAGMGTVLLQSSRPITRKGLVVGSVPVVLPFGGVVWEPIAAKGNVKLPFVAYSHLPMVSCPGAGRCAVYEEEEYEAVRMVKDPETGQVVEHRSKAKHPYHRGFCYSFKAWRYPDAFARMFLSTLAHYADREFAIFAASGGQDVLPVHYDERIRLALSPAGRAKREWPQFVKQLILKATEPTLLEGKMGFCRLFVDGDIDNEDSIVEWMDVCRDLGPGGKDIEALRKEVCFANKRRWKNGKCLKPKKTSNPRGSERGKMLAGIGAEKIAYVEVYGYTKCWQSFVNADAYYKQTGQVWPSNYTVNLSSHSVYSKTDEDPDRPPNHPAVQTQRAMNELPIARGFFEAVDLAKYVKDLREVYDPSTKSLRTFKLPDPKTVQFAFSEGVLRDFMAINEELSLPMQTTRERLRKGLLMEMGAEVVEERRKSPTEAAKRVSRMFRAERLRGFLDRAASMLQRFGASEPLKLPETNSEKEIVTSVRRQVYSAYFAWLLNDSDFMRVVKQEIQLDAIGKMDEQAYLQYVEEEEKEAIKDLITQKGLSRAEATERRAYTTRILHNKALALSLHQLLFALGLGSVCPLACGNCSDAADPRSQGLHRCASKTAYKDMKIKIGLH